MFADKHSMARAAAEHAATAICEAIAERGCARIIAATGASQVEFLEELTKTSGVDWEKVELFHLDEYLNMPATHPASFRKYLRERLINKVGIKRAHLLDASAMPRKLLPR